MSLSDILLRLPPLRRRLLRLKALEEKIEITRSRFEVSDDLFDAFEGFRGSDSYSKAFSIPSPLVTVCIATYNRASLLMSRSARSVLAQTYRNIELIVVGDACTDDTAERMAKIHDSRARFVNLPEQGDYPEDPECRWMVAGTAPINHALSLATGQFITHLDDDDEFLPNRVQALVDFVQQNRVELVWHPFFAEDANGHWDLKSCEEFTFRHVTTSSVFYHAWLKRIPWDIHAYRFREPGDWNRFRKFKYLGVRCLRYPEPLLRHYRERSQMGPRAI